MGKPLPNALDIDFRGGLTEEVTPHAGVTLLVGLGRRSGVMAAAERHLPSVARPLKGNPNDIFCLKEERKVAKDHTISLDGVTYTLPSEPCLVAFRVQLHIHPGERLRVWHSGRLVVELPHVDKGRLRDAPLTVEQVLEEILPAT